MPIHEFKCPSGHITEKLFLSFGAAHGVDVIPCGTCEEAGTKIDSVPLPAHFYGNPDGYDRPSPAKRYSTKLAAQNGNEHSMG